jgi:hypothetical protein
MFINIKIIKRWLVHPIEGKLTFKVVEYQYQKMRHVKDKWHTKEEFHSKKTVLTNVGRDEAERFVFLKEHNKPTK